MRAAHGRRLGSSGLARSLPGLRRLRVRRRASASSGGVGRDRAGRPGPGHGGLLAALGLLCWVLAACTGDPVTMGDQIAEFPPPPLDTLDLWAGLTPPTVAPEDIADELRPAPGPARPPQVGEEIELAFPPPEGPSEGGGASPPPEGPARVLRYGPEGPQGLVDAFRVTFDRPMVPLASIDALRDAPVPLRIEPEVPGEFRWLGTRTVAFVPEGRLPFSTRYVATVPGDAVAADGQGLDRSVSWEVTTPGLALASSAPSGGATGVVLEPTVVLTFNQPVARARIEADLSLVGPGGAVPVEVVAPERWDELPEVAGLGARPAFERDRTVVLRPRRALRPDTRYRVRLPAGAYGEGPVASEALETSFSTYPPLRLAYRGCRDRPCPANRGIFLEASTPLGGAPVEALVQVEPEVEDLRVSAYGASLALQGRFEGDVTYRVRVAAGLEDIHGQTLGKAFEQGIPLGPLDPELRVWPIAKDPGVVESGARHTLGLKVAGLDQVELAARGFGLDEVHRYLRGNLYARDYDWPDGLPEASFAETLDVGESRRRSTRLDLDLDRVRGDKPFAFLVARSNPIGEAGRAWRRGLRQVFSVTDLGVSGAFDARRGVVVVSRLSDGRPVPGAELRLLGAGGQELWKGRSDRDGFAHPSYGTSIGSEALVLVSAGEEAAFLPLDGSDLRGRWVGGALGRRPEDAERVFFFTDREPYKPGETMHVAGILRRVAGGPDGGVSSWGSSFSARYQVEGPRGIEIASGEVAVGPFGTFSVDVPVPKDGDTGQYRFTFTVPRLFSSDHVFHHSVAVETYRTPEFKVDVSRTDEGPLRFGELLEVEIAGAYYQGSALVGADATWSLERRSTGFRPPGDQHRGFTFGAGQAAQPGWRGGALGPWSPSVTVAGGAGTLDAAGRLRLSHAVTGREPPLGSEGPQPPAGDENGDEAPLEAATYSLSAVVSDESRQAIAARGDWVVHPARIYAGLRSERAVLRVGERGRVEAVAVDVEGLRRAGVEIDLRVIRQETRREARQVGGRWTYVYETEEHEVARCELRSAQAPVACDFTVQAAGAHEIRARVRDEDGRSSESRTRVYAIGDDAVVWDDERRRIDIVADRDRYTPGDTATLLLRSPFDRGVGLLVVEREGIAREIPFEFEGGAHTLQLPITDQLIGGASVSAFVVRGRVEIPGAPADQDLGIPAVAVGELELEISTETRTLAVEVTPDRPRVAPGGKLRVDLRSLDHEGKGVPSAVALMVVDEGVLALMNYRTPDPVSFFWARRPPGTGLFSSVDAVLARDAGAREGELAIDNELDGDEGLVERKSVARPPPSPARSRGAEDKGGGGAPGLMAPAAAREEAPEAEEAAAVGPAGALDPAQAMAQPVSLRTLFATTAFFDGQITTDASGAASVEIDMPENLTTFRIMAVAVDQERDDRFGSGEAQVTVRKPIMLRPSLPRFANLGDRFEGSVMVDNQTDADQQVLVGVRGANVELPGETKHTITVAAGASREVRFEMAPERVGNMRLQFAALSNAGRDATELTVPVNLPATRQAFADYGMVESSVSQPLEVPEDALVAFGGLELSLSSTALNGLEDAVSYLVSYPYECAEQTASRILPIFALGPVLDDFPIATVVNREQREQLARAGIDRLLQNQAPDGGFGYWHGRESWPYVSAWATHALLEGKARGFTVPQPALDRALAYLEGFLARGHRTRWGSYYDDTTRAFALWLLSREGRGELHFEAVWARRAQLPLYARAMLMATAHRFGRSEARDGLLAELRDAAVDDARTVHFVESRSEADTAGGLTTLMHASVQTDAIVLLALLEVAPDDPMAPKVMAGIMSGRDPRKGGRWSTTHANAWALLAASAYYTAVESETPDFLARLWLDADFGGEQRFEGRSMAKRNLRVPMAALRAKDYGRVTLSKEGPGKLYYRLGLRYAPASLRLDAVDRGFEVHRSYEAIPEVGQTPEAAAEAVRQDADGTWRVKAGTNVKVNLTLTSVTPASYVVVDDALPGGFEGQNPRFVTSVAAQSASGRDPGWGQDDEAPYRGRWWFPWWSWSHTQMKDDRMLLFADRLPAGVYTYSYTARATSIGEFVLPPIHAEGMYEPERFGHSASGRVVVYE